MSWEWDNGVPRIPQRCGKSPDRCPTQWQEGSLVELRGPSLPQAVQVFRNPNSGALCKQSGTPGALVLQLRSLRWQSIQGRCLEGKVIGRPRICLLISKHHPNGPWRLGRWGGDLVKFTPFWPDQSWFWETMHLAIDPPRWFRPSQWLLWNATTRNVM